jgi:hypothetical protein
MGAILWQPGGFLVFVFLTLILGGAAAMASGAAIARTWRPVLQVPLYMIPLSLTVRFLHYALFQQPLLSVQYLLVTFVILTALGMFGFHQRRRSQMQRQYGWLKG